MLETNYNAIPEKLFENYLNFLIGKVYKILCMYDEKDVTLPKYIQSLQRELIGNQELIIELKYDGNFLALLNKLEYLIHNDLDKKDFKKDIFDSISLINKLTEKYKLNEEVNK